VLFGVGATATEAQVKQYGLADGALVVLAPEADAAAAKAPKKPAEAPAQTTPAGTTSAPASAPASSTSAASTAPAASTTPKPA
jgi:hypothetical protein